MNRNVIRFQLAKIAFLQNLRNLNLRSLIAKKKPVEWIGNYAQRAGAYFKRIVFLRRMRKNNDCVFSHMAHSLGKATSRLQEVNRKVECFNNDFAWNKMKD